VIRQHALGKFSELLHASAKSGAMQFYLDNFLNQAVAPNENYARELMELHTLGVDGGYTEMDVKEVTRCFTGWSLRFPSDPGGGHRIHHFRRRYQRVLTSSVFTTGIFGKSRSKVYAAE